MTWKPAALLSLLALLCACAEGGTRGSGISTFVLGNVVSSPVVTGLEPDDLGGIRVVVEGTGVAVRTAADGSFSLDLGSSIRYFGDGWQISKKFGGRHY